MSHKFNENIDIKRLKADILSQLKGEQNKLIRNLETKMEETNRLINDSNAKFQENKVFFENILSQKYYFDKLDNLEKTYFKLNDSLLAHEIRISKNIDDINSLRTKYDKIILDNLLLPGQIGPSCQYKNLAQYLKSNIYDMARMKGDNDNIKSIANELKIRLEMNNKNITGLLENCVVRSNQYTDSRITDCISVLEHKMKESSEKLMEMRMKNIQSQDKLQEYMDIFKQNYEEQVRVQDEKLAKFEEMLGRLNESMPEEFKIVNEIEKLKYKIKKIKNVLVDYINNSQQIQPTSNFNQSQQLKVRRNSTIGYEYSSTNNNNNLEKIFPGPKNQKMDNKANDSLMSSNIDKDITPSKAQKQNINTNNINTMKYKSNYQQRNTQKKMIDISEISSDNDEIIATKQEKQEKQDNFNSNIKKNLKNDLSGRMNNASEPKKNKNISNRSNRVVKDKGSKSNNKSKINKNASKIIKKDNSYLNSFDSLSDTSDKNNNSKEKDRLLESKAKLIYQNKKNIEKIMIQSKTLNSQEKSIYTFNNSKINNSGSQTNNFDISNNISTMKSKNVYQSNSRNMNNKTINNQFPNISQQQSQFYRTQQEEKKEIIKDFFTKYDKNSIPENLSLIKNRANLDLYNYSVSPPDKNHFLDTKYDEIYNPPLSKDLFFNKNNNSMNGKFYPTSKTGSVPKTKNNFNLKINLGNTMEANSKKLGTFFSGEKKIYINNNNTITNSRFIKNKKMEYANKFTNTYYKK